MIEYLPLKSITALHAEEIHEAVARVTDSGWYLRGECTRRFELDYAEYIGTKHCVGCANGLDALTLIIRAYKELGRLKEGDEIIVPANTYIATILSITENALVPVLVEPSIDTLQIDDKRIEQAITAKTRAIMIVHLYGRCAYTALIGDICRRHNLLLIEDNAQAHGCQFSHNKRTGSLGNAVAHSFYPTKNLGAMGDAGAVTTNDDELANMIRALGNYGSSHHYVFDYIGRNSRIDEIQAAVLSVKLRHLDADNARRREIAAIYLNSVHHPDIFIPNNHESNETLTPQNYNNVYHIFPILSPRRDELRQYLLDNGVQTEIHYPIPPHRQKCYAEHNSLISADAPTHSLSLSITERIHREELSLPCHTAMTNGEAITVASLMNRFPTF